MEAGIAAVLGGAIGGTLALAGGWLERRWADKRRWQLDKKTAYVQLITQPLILIWDANMLLERRHSPRDRSLPSLVEMEERMRSVLSGIGEAFSSVCAIGSPSVIASGSHVLESCLELMQQVVHEHQAGDIAANVDRLSSARLALLEEVRADLGTKDSSGLPIGEE